jgi:hypothetical protein
MSYEAWPSPDAPRGPLPRIEDLPISEHGYDQEAVREAFDAFYRHAAQLDASLRALESVEVFRREAAELRADLRSVRALGFGGEGGWSSPSYSYGYAYERPPRELPAGALRVAAEAALVIGVAVIAGVAQFRAWVIVAVMAAAWAIVAVSEWLAARARYRVPESVYATATEAGAEQELEAPEPVGWPALEAEREERPPDEQTMVESLAEAEAEAEPAPEIEKEPAPEAEPEPEPVAAPEPAAHADEPRRRRWFRRGSAEPAAEEEQAAPEEEPAPPPQEEPEPVVEAAAPPSHVRVLPAVDPWERGFDGEDETDESELADRGGLGRARRRRR